MRRTITKLTLLTSLLSLGAYGSDPLSLGILPYAELTDAKVPPERELPAAGKALTQKFEEHLTRLASPDFAVRKKASDELVQWLRQGTVDERAALLGMVLAAERNDNTPQEAVARLGAAVETAGASMSSIRWLAAYCRFIAEEAERMKPFEALSDKLVEAVEKIDTSKHSDFFHWNEEVRSDEEKVAEARALLWMKENKQNPKGIARNRDRIDYLKSEYEQRLKTFGEHNEQVTPVAAASAYAKDFIEHMESVGLEVTPTLVTTVRSGTRFVVSDGKNDVKVILEPSFSAIRGRGHSFAIQVEPPGEKSKEVALSDYLDPLVVRRYDWSGVPTFQRPALALGTDVSIFRGKPDGGKVPVIRMVSGREPRDGGPTPSAAAFPDSVLLFMRELQPQLRWDEPYPWNTDPEAKAIYLEKSFVVPREWKEKSQGQACGSFKVPRLRTLRMERAPLPLPSRGGTADLPPGRVRRTQ